MSEKLTIIIPIMPRSKKNSQRIVVNPHNHKTIILQSELYKQYEKDCAIFMPKLEKPIYSKINLKCIFIVPDKRKRDLVNLLNAIQDILVKYKVIQDDNYNIVHSIDGSRIVYKENVAKTIVEIEYIKEE